MNKNEEIVLQLSHLSGDGKAVGKLDGLVVFADNAVPGDLARVRIWKVKKNYAEGRAVEILEPSEHRVSARCRHFGICGGCRWQNLSYQAQKEFKRLHIENVFKHIGEFDLPNVLPTIGTESPYFYRNKMEYTFSNRRWLTQDEMNLIQIPENEVALGFHVPERFDKVLNTTECFLQSEISAQIVNKVREFCRSNNLSVYSTKTHEGYLRHLVIRDSKKTGEMMINLVTTNFEKEVIEQFTQMLRNEFPPITTIVNNITERKSMIAIGETEKIMFGPGYITERLGDYTFKISANSFFQTNTMQAEKLYDIVKDFADLKSSDVVYDLYGGTGTIAIYLSDAVERVIGIEVVDSAIHDAEKNAEVNHIANCYFLQGDLKDRLTTDRSWLAEHPEPSVIILDPPRSGVHAKVIDQILKIKSQRIVYVSCNPATQARDSKLLADGGYSLQKIQPVDMFPHTDHIESVALFTLR
ncbi:MAG: 23S rRNA (uracil(1939)-C(5))-methyltransferase RlmD [Ignavibacteriales bacterium]|nr:23S rRNA (uracil(1939)-C(5))-methyltransferase RlmD [Ignavibacteriales bacterium]